MCVYTRNIPKVMQSRAVCIGQILRLSIKMPQYTFSLFYRPNVISETSVCFLEFSELSKTTQCIVNIILRQLCRTLLCQKKNASLSEHTLNFLTIINTDRENPTGFSTVSLRACRKCVLYSNTIEQIVGLRTNRWNMFSCSPGFTGTAYSLCTGVNLLK